MTIELNYILKRNKSDLAVFIKKNKLTSYVNLVEYCNSRNFIPCSEEEYDKIALKDTSKNERRKSTRAASKTQAPKKRRYRRKKQQDTSKLSDSSDKR